MSTPACMSEEFIRAKRGRFRGVWAHGIELKERGREVAKHDREEE